MNTIRYDCVAFVRHVNVVKSLCCYFSINGCMDKGYWDAIGK